MLKNSLAQHGGLQKITGLISDREAVCVRTSDDLQREAPHLLVVYCQGHGKHVYVLVCKGLLLLPVMYRGSCPVLHPDKWRHWISQLTHFVFADVQHSITLSMTCVRCQLWTLCSMHATASSSCSPQRRYSRRRMQTHVAAWAQAVTCAWLQHIALHVRYEESVACHLNHRS